MRKVWLMNSQESLTYSCVLLSYAGDSIGLNRAVLAIDSDLHVLKPQRICYFPPNASAWPRIFLVKRGWAFPERCSIVENLWRNDEGICRFEKTYSIETSYLVFSRFSVAAQLVSAGVLIAICTRVPAQHFLLLLHCVRGRPEPLFHPYWHSKVPVKYIYVCSRPFFFNHQSRWDSHGEKSRFKVLKWMLNLLLELYGAFCWTARSNQSVIRDTWATGLFVLDDCCRICIYLVVSRALYASEIVLAHALI